MKCLLFLCLLSTRAMFSNMTQTYPAIIMVFTYLGCHGLSHLTKPGDVQVSNVGTNNFRQKALAVSKVLIGAIIYVR